MADDFAQESLTWMTPAENWSAITPSDITDLENKTRGIYVGTTGDIRCVDKRGQIATFKAVQGGMSHPIRTARVLSTGTTATDLLALW